MNRRSLKFTDPSFIIRLTLPLALLLSREVAALPKNSPLGGVAEDPVHRSFFSNIQLPNADRFSVGVWIFFGIWALFIFCKRVMPKTLRERTVDRNHKVSPIGSHRAKDIQEKEAKESHYGEKFTGREINKIWIEAIQNDPGWERRQSVEKEKQRDFSAESSPFPSRTGSRHPELPPLMPINQYPASLLLPHETYNFGDNPNYHDERFQYNPAPPTGSSSTPPSPFSSRFYPTKIKKVMGHRRSQSSPSAHPSGMHPPSKDQRNFMSTTHFPLPTLRPITPPETMSTPGSPTLKHHEDDNLANMRAYQYSKHYTQAVHTSGHYRAQSVPLTESTEKPVTGAQSIHRALPTPEEEGQGMHTQRAISKREDGVFQPVIIFEQGQSLTGQKWRRKVTVFRSEVLDKLEKEGMVIC